MIVYLSPSPWLYSYSSAISKLEAEVHAAISAKREADKALGDARNEVASLRKQLEEERGKVASLSATASTGASSGGMKDEDVKALVQLLYNNVYESLVPEGSDQADLQYSAADVLQKLRAMMKFTVAQYKNSAK
jgi:hypothetical protein